MVLEASSSKESSCPPTCLIVIKSQKEPKILPDPEMMILGLAWKMNDLRSSRKLNSIIYLNRSLNKHVFDNSIEANFSRLLKLSHQL
jgi:hypothetical protein